MWSTLSGMRYVAAMIVAAVFVSACGSDDRAATEFVERLESRGATVEFIDNSEVGFWTARSSSSYCVNGEVVSVLTYASKQRLGEDIQALQWGSPWELRWYEGDVGNSSYRAANVEWAGYVKFWGQGRLMVMYSGTTDTMVELISSEMGPPFDEVSEGGFPPGPSPCRT